MTQITWQKIESLLRTRKEQNARYQTRSGRLRKIDQPFISSCRTVFNIVSANGRSILAVPFEDVKELLLAAGKNENGISDYNTHLDMLKRIATQVEPETNRVRESETNIPDTIRHSDVLAAMEAFELPEGFGESTHYDVLDPNGNRFPPKAIVGIAAREYVDEALTGKHFQGGPGTKCFRILEALGFQIVPKPTCGRHDANETARDIDAIRRNSAIDKPTRRRLVEARTGQGQFRRDVLRIENSCRVTGIRDKRFLIAGHVVPFSLCSLDAEKYDPHNGLAFTPAVDRLFENGLLSFKDDGSLITSPELPDDVRRAFIPEILPERRPFNSLQTTYLDRHRKMHGHVT